MNASSQIHIAVRVSSKQGHLRMYKDNMLILSQI